MQPYYEHAGITIYHGDCREILLDLSTETIITDPPYGIRANVKGASSRRGNRDFKNCSLEGKDWPAVQGDDKPFDPTHLLAASEVILWGGNHFSSRLPDAACWIVWDKRAGGASDDNADCEMAWTNLHGPARLISHLWRGWIRAGRENISVSGDKLHPFQKPIAVMKFCLLLSKTSGPVLDPYCGSGSTLLAAKELGREAIGIEIEEKYCEIAAKRLSQEVFEFA